MTDASDQQAGESIQRREVVTTWATKKPKPITATPGNQKENTEERRPAGAPLRLVGRLINDSELMGRKLALMDWSPLDQSSLLVPGQDPYSGVSAWASTHTQTNTLLYLQGINNILCQVVEEAEQITEFPGEEKEQELWAESRSSSSFDPAALLKLHSNSELEILWACAADAALTCSQWGLKVMTVPGAPFSAPPVFRWTCVGLLKIQICEKSWWKYNLMSSVTQHYSVPLHCKDPKISSNDWGACQGYK